MEVAEQSVESVDHGATALGELVTAVGQEPQHSAVVLGSDPAQARLALGDPRHAGSVDRVGLAAVASSEQAGPGRQRRRHVQDRLPVRDELLRQEMAETAGALHGPDPFGPALGPAQKPLEHRLGRDHADLTEQATVLVERDGGMRRLVGIDPDGDHGQPPSGDRDQRSPRRAT
jgi:hypothetical protein